MDLTQTKLTKTEWVSIEMPVSDAELAVLRLIKAGFADVGVRENANRSLLSLMKLESSPAMAAHLYTLDTQFTDYRAFDYARTAPYMHRYFHPAASIRALKARLRIAYGIDANRCCALYYRGTDKHTETALAPFAPFAVFGDRLQERIAHHAARDEPLSVLLQTDSAPFQEYMLARFPGAVVLRENATSHTNRGIHNETAPDKNYEDMHHLLATVLLMARCKLFICSSGNVSHWTTLYRGGAHGVHQYLADRWLDQEPASDSEQASAHIQ